MSAVLFKKFLTPFILVCALAACDAAEDRAKDHLANGKRLAAEGEYIKASLEFRNALRLDETLVEARYAYAVILVDQKNLRGALEQFKAVVTDDPTFVPARLRMAELFLVGGALDDAALMMEAAFAEAPNDPEVLALDATVHYRRGNREEALAQAEAALALAPNLITALLVKIADRIDSGASDEAMALLDRSIAEDPDNGSLHVVRLNLLNQQGDRQATEAQLRRLIEIYPEDGDLPITLARLRFLQGDRDEAEALLRASAAQRQDDSRAALAVVQFLREVDGESAARSELERLSSSEPDRVDYIIALAATEFDSGEREAAIARLRAAIDRESFDTVGRTRARTALASMLIVQGDLEMAEVILNQTLAADGEDADALTLRGRVLLDRDQIEPAVTDLRNALSQRPASPTILMLMAAANLRLGNEAQAEDNLSQAARVSGYAPEPVRRYVVQLLAGGRPDIAEKVLEDALEANGRRADLLAAIGEIRLVQQNWVGARRVGEELKSLPVVKGTVANAADRILAAALEGEGKSDQSVSLLEASWNQAGGGDRMAIRALTDAYLKNGQQDRAVEFLDSVVARYPNNIDALIQRSRVYIAARDISTAQTTLEKAVALQPANPAPRMALLEVLIGTDQIDAAIAEARDALAKSEVDAPAIRLVLATQLAQTGQRAAAIAEYDILYDQFPANPAVANNLASLLYTGTPTEEEIERAYVIARPLRNQRAAQFRETYGWSVFLRGNTREALAVLEPLGEVLTDSPLAQLHLGLVYEAVGRPEDAKRVLEAALALAEAGAPFEARDRAEAALARIGSN